MFGEYEHFLFIKMIDYNTTPLSLHEAEMQCSDMTRVKFKQ